MRAPQSAIPPAAPLKMSSTTSGPASATQSPVPPQPKKDNHASSASKPQKKPDRVLSPILRFKVRDLSSQGSRDFLKAVDAGTVVQEAVQGVVERLYTPSSVVPGTRSVTLILRPMEGVAYTTGKDYDSDHKEIHFSTDYIARIAKERKEDEILGVLRHEMVHCWQWNALGTAPGGLIEGIADWVRLQSDMAPPHWTKEGGGDWDAGYQHTGYFLEYLEQQYGKGSVMAVNEALRDKKYDEDKFWNKLFGHPVDKLWKDYGKSLKVQEEGGPKKEGNDSSNGRPRKLEIRDKDIKESRPQSKSTSALGTTPTAPSSTQPSKKKE
ncbi:MAG: hypothetical protein M1827_001817 [Pycnora praestabilis]|nr:MAG: hypothetical protein M1827_001817 [Pycnora praestabilis]